MGVLEFILVVQVDNYIYCVEKERTDEFEDFLQTKFTVGELERDNFSVIGCEIQTLDDKSISMNQK